MKLKSKFLEAFKSLGLRWHLTETTFNVLEEYVCMLYGQNTKDVNAARSNMFLKKYSSTSKIIDLALLSPCQSYTHKGQTMLLKFGKVPMWLGMISRTLLIMAGSIMEKLTGLILYFQRTFRIS